MRLIAELARYAYDKREGGRKRKEALGGVLLYLQVELERNWLSLQAAYGGRAHQALQDDVYNKCAQVLGAELLKHPSLRHAIEDVYAQMTDGLRHELARGLVNADNADDIGELWNAVGRALVEIERFLDDENLLSNRPAGRDCIFRRFGELIAGCAPTEQRRVTAAWREFERAAAQPGGVRLFTSGELNAVTMYREPVRELKFRQEARHRWGHLYAYEVDDGIYEYWVCPSRRILFARMPDRLVALDIVSVHGLHKTGWTPRWYVRRARCRRESLQFNI